MTNQELAERLDYLQKEIFKESQRHYSELSMFGVIIERLHDRIKEDIKKTQEKIGQ